MKTLPTVSIITTSLDILPYSTPFNNQSINNVPIIITPISTYFPSPLTPLREGRHCHRSNNSNNSGGSNNNRTTTPLRQTIISPVGDMLIRLLTPTHTLHYKASAGVVITTSKIFSAMLSPTSPFSEAQPFNNSPYSSTEPFILMLHDDGPVALRTPPKALHNHPSVPWLLSFRQLVKMAVAVDKYDCLHATRMYGDS